MSSVLKALRNQQSPLLQQPGSIALQSAQQGTGILIKLFIAVAVIFIAGVSGWLISQQLMNNASGTHSAVSQDEQPVTAPAQYQLGSVVAIIQPNWRIETEVEPEVTEQPGDELISAAEQQADSSVVNDNQAIDLNQISPEMLSAFESALGEQGENLSVVPTLAQLSPSFQRSIPSFSYDGHQYSSRPNSRWIEFSGIRIFEGESYQGLTILAIAPAHVVLSKNDQAFQQPALEDWTKP
jgi:general secretion pathway protein B